MGKVNPNISKCNHLCIYLVILPKFNQLLLQRIADNSEPHSQEERGLLQLIEFRIANHLRKTHAYPNKFVSLSQNMTENPDRAPEVIAGLLRERETMNIIAAPKTGKTWLVMQLAVALATGGVWLGRLCAQKRVLVIDNELHPGELTYRYKELTDALKLSFDDLEGKLYLWSQRGTLLDLEAIGARLNRIRELGIGIVIIDAFYRAIPAGIDENSNSEIMSIYNLLDRYSKQTGASFILVHHTSKGSQKEKSVTDLGAGAGSQSRATDTHLTLVPCETKADAGRVEVKGVVRSFKPFVPFKIEQKHFPLWESVEKTPVWFKSELPALSSQRTVAMSLYLNYHEQAIYQTALIETIKLDFGVGYERAKALVDEAIARGEMNAEKVVERGREFTKVWTKKPENLAEFQKVLPQEFQITQ